MIKTLLRAMTFALTIALTSLSCEKSSHDPFEHCSQTTEEYLFFDTLAVDSLLLQYTRSVDMSNCACADCGEGDILTFKIKKGVNAFQIDAIDLPTADITWLGLIGFCGCYHEVLIAEGSIQGEKVNDEKWKVEVNLERELGEPLKFKKHFILGN